MATDNKSFLSIKWKAGLLFGALLLIFNTIFPLLVYWNLDQRFVFSREQIQQQFQQEILGQLQATSATLQRLSEIIIIPDSSHSNESFNKEIISLLDKNKNSLELEWQVSQAQYLDNSGARLGGWGTDLPTNINALISKVLLDEVAHTQIDCSQGCKQYDLIPVLNNGQSNNLLVIAYDLSNTLFDFSDQTGADLAVLTKHDQDITKKGLLLPEWNMHVSALTSYHENLPYLQSLAHIYALSDLDHHQIIRHKTLPVEFHLVPSEQVDDVLFVIIDNIAAQRQEVLDITYRSVFISLLGVLIIGGGLFFFLSEPLTRLSSVSQALPLLARQKFNEVREQVIPNDCSHTLDELDLLEHATHDLTSQLEHLHDSVKERTELINMRSSELQRERDFIKSLIDTAQLIIITIDKQCRISSFNDFAENVTGYLEKDIINTPIERFFPEEQWPEVRSTLIELKQNPNTVSQQESEFILNNGEVHIISWLHSSLGTTEGPVVLSVGLDITDKKRSEEQIVWMADHDVLTGLYNRRKFNIEFEQILHHATRFEHYGVLLFLDLDQFKDINDSCGHKIGDQLLKQVAQTLSDTTRNTDVVARLGGDEFAVILPETNEVGAVKLAEKIAAQFSLLDTMHKGVRYKISCSIGLVAFPIKDLSVEELISNADLAMYQAKAKGKNTWHIFRLDGQAREQLETRVLWKQKIEDALEQKRFIFYYQPIMNIRKQTVSHYEVLLRMQDEDGTINLPGTFIQVAEQTGLIHNIDHYVLQQGIYKQAELDKLDANISLSLNLSGHAIDDPILLPLLKRLLAESSANPNKLIFELTETAAVADILQAKELMIQMSSVGCRFSLDDFGTGFASFRYMRELPVDIVKIDGSFIQNLADNRDDQLFVKALVDVAKGMGKKTVAEFVENAETLSLLHTFGVDYAQGYYIGRPEPHFLRSPPDLK